MGSSLRVEKSLEPELQKTRKRDKIKRLIIFKILLRIRKIIKLRRIKA